MNTFASIGIDPGTHIDNKVDALGNLPGNSLLARRPGHVGKKTDSTRSRVAVRRILFVTEALSDSWIRSMELMRELTGRGIQIAAAVIGPEPSARQLKETRTLQRVQWFHGDFALDWTEPTWREMEEAGEWLQTLATDFAADIVHVFSWAHAGLHWNQPVILSVDADQLHPLRQESVRVREHRRQVEAALDAASRVIVPTRSCWQLLENEMAVPCEITVMPPGIGKTPQAGEKQPLILATPGELLPNIISSLRWPAFPLLQPLVTESNPMGVRRRFDPSGRALQFATAGIFAGLGKNEIPAAHIWEAAIGGTALVLADLPGHRELWDGCAEFVSPINARTWIRTLNEISTNPERCQRLQRAARERAEHHAGKQSGAAYVDIYRRTLNKPAFALGPTTRLYQF